MLHLCSPVALPRPHPEDNRPGGEWVGFPGHSSLTSLLSLVGRVTTVASLCGQLEWISDQRLPRRCHSLCYPFSINQRPGSQPPVQSSIFFSFLFVIPVDFGANFNHQTESAPLGSYLHM